MSLVTSRQPALTQEESIAAMQRAAEHALAHGAQQLQCAMMRTHTNAKPAVRRQAAASVGISYSPCFL